MQRNSHDALIRLERSVGVAVYDRIADLMNARAGTPEAAELLALTALVEGVEGSPKDGTTGCQLGPGRDQETALNHQEGEP